MKKIVPLVFAALAWLMLAGGFLWWIGFGAAIVAVLLANMTLRSGAPGEHKTALLTLGIAVGAAVCAIVVLRSVGS